MPLFHGGQDMNEKIIESLLLREGMPDELLLVDILNDCETDLKDMLHVDELTEEHIPILKELVLIKVNHDGVEGIQSESHSGNSTTYLDDLPKSLKRKINAKRRLPR